MIHLSYLQAVVLGLLQGVTELFPVSSLGHSVLVPALLGGSWERLVTAGRTNGSYLSFVVGLHVATAAALLLFFWRDWVRIIGGFVSSIRQRRIVTADQRLAWLIVVATIPTGLIGLIFEHSLRALFARPLAAAGFLVVNGLIMFWGERLRSHQEARQVAVGPGAATRGVPADAPLDAARSAGIGADEAASRAADAALASRITLRDAVLIGIAQICALFAGISRSGVTIVAGLGRGLDHEDAARFAFLLATPIILAAGVLKLPELAAPAAAGIRGQVVVGSVVSGVAAYLSVRFLTRYFQRRTLRPFAIYSVVLGVAAGGWLLFG